jgi:hypothetical protein
MLLAIGLLLIGIPVFAALVLAFSLLAELWSRELILGQSSIGGAVAGSMSLLRSKPLQIGLMWLILALISFAVGVLMLPAFVAAAIAGGVIAIGVGAAVSAGGFSALAALLAGILAFGILVAPPMLFLSGIFTAFRSCAWTLTWRELRGRRGSSAALETSGLLST